ncbi:MAG: hypothetical protein AB7K09_19850 [Planctomycetota bacterium]
MAWITTPPHTRKVIDDRDRRPFDADGAAPAPDPDDPTAAVHVPAAHTGATVVPPPAAPVNPTDSSRYRAPSAAPTTGTTRVLRTSGGNGEPLKAEGGQFADLSVFRRYPALFHRMAARKRGWVGVRLSLYDMVLIGALLVALIYLLVMAFFPAAQNHGLPGAPPPHSGRIFNGGDGGEIAVDAASAVGAPAAISGR